MKDATGACIYCGHKATSRLSLEQGNFVWVCDGIPCMKIWAHKRPIPEEKAQ